MDHYGASSPRAYFTHQSWSWIRRSILFSSSSAWGVADENGSLHWIEAEAHFCCSLEALIIFVNLHKINIISVEALLLLYINIIIIATCDSSPFSTPVVGTNTAPANVWELSNNFKSEYTDPSLHKRRDCYWASTLVPFFKHVSSLTIIP